jgi:hypothetical protein
MYADEFCASIEGAAHLSWEMPPEQYAEIGCILTLSSIYAAKGSGGLGCNFGIV